MVMSMVLKGYIRFGLTVIVAILLLWIILRYREKKNPQKSSLNILKVRLEKGEITEAEYQAAKEKQQR